MSMDPEAPEPAGLEAEIERVNGELAELLIEGDRHAADVLLDELRELRWLRRAATVRGRRQRASGGPMSDGGDVCSNPAEAHATGRPAVRRHGPGPACRGGSLAVAGGHRSCTRG